MSLQGLHFKSINPLASKTLLLLHGAFSSHHEWDHVCRTAHLSSYHLLIPDLPSHGQSTSATLPLNLPDTAALLADIITKHAKDGKANLVGMSLGGYTSIYVAQKYPDLIGDGGLFVSGVGQSWPRGGAFMSWIYGLVLFSSAWVSTHVPRSVFTWLCAKTGLVVNEDLYMDMRASSGYRLGQTLARALADDASAKGKENWKARCQNVRSRTCVVAGVLDDSEKDCVERGKQLRVGNLESRSFKVEGRRHAWDLQDPELFALGIKAWIEREDMPDGYISID